MKRKIIKLFKNPKNFIKDFFLKHESKLIKLLPIRLNASKKYTIITAVYNSAEFLDDFFTSITNQTIHFKKYIYIICIDDGSTDKSKEIIQQWKKKFPNNIKYLNKINEGQASARNLGISYANTDWITFIDPDDFVHYDYFRRIDKIISFNPNVKFVSTYLIFFLHQKKIFRDSHPLRYKFEKKDRILDIKKIDESITLSSASSFFLRDQVINNGILFDEKIKPNFEDAKFILNYINSIDNGNIAFVKKAKYFYRKHTNSTLSNSWQNPKKFYDIFIYGFLPELQSYEKSSIPTHTKITILYDINNYINYLKNDNGMNKIFVISENEYTNFLYLLKKTIDYIDDEIIINYKNMTTVNKMIVLVLIKHKNMVGLYLNYTHKKLSNTNKIKIFLFTADKNIINTLQSMEECGSVTIYYLNTLPLYRVSIFITSTDINHILSNFDNDSFNKKIFLTTKENLNFINTYKMGNYHAY